MRFKDALLERNEQYMPRNSIEVVDIVFEIIEYAYVIEWIYS